MRPTHYLRPDVIAQVQRLVAILSDPGGTRDEEAIWDKAASEILEAVILHVLYTAEDADKTLLKVRELLADLDDTAEVMVKALHRAGIAIAHYQILVIGGAAQGFAGVNLPARFILFQDSHGALHIGIANGVAHLIEGDAIAGQCIRV